MEEVIATLQLDTCRDTVIGSALQRGISGGQLKRVNIALALITRLAAPRCPPLPPLPPLHPAAPRCPTPTSRRTHAPRELCCTLLSQAIET